MMRWIALVILGWCLLMGPPAMAQARCDACGKKIESLDQPIKLAGTWLFTRDDLPTNAQPGIDTSAWKVIKAPGPWKKAYDDKQVYQVGWYRGSFEFSQALVGQEVVVLLNTYMAHMQLFVNGKEVYRRPDLANVSRFYSIQAAPVRFVIPDGKVDIAIRVDTPLMTGVYQLPFEMHRYDANDNTLVGWAVWGGEMRVTVGWIALFFGLFFLLVYVKVKYSMYLVASVSTMLGWIFLSFPADYLVAVFPTKTLTYLHYVGLYGVMLFFIFAQYFYKFFPRLNVAFAIVSAIPVLGIAAMTIHENLVVFQTLRSVFFLMLLAMSVACIYFYARGVAARQQGAGIMLVGMILFSVASFNDALLGMGVIQSVSLGATGLSLYLGAMLFVASRRFSDTFVENKRLVRDLTSINENLEGLVSDRTAALREKTNDIQSMLQNMPQGVLTIVAGSKIHPEYSAYLETIFGTKNIAGRDAMEFLFSTSNLGSDARSQVETAMSSVIGEDSMNYEFNSHLLVAECDMVAADGSNKSLEFSWSPIADESDNVEKLMLCVRDVTEYKRLAAEAAGQKRELDLIGEILRVSQEKFQAFIDSSNAFIVENRQVIEAQTGRNADAVNLLFRNMHTIKGNARTYGLLNMTNAVHEAEVAYDALRKDEDAVWDAPALLAQLDTVDALVNEYAKINDVTLGRKGPGRRGSVEKFLMVDKDQLGKALQQLDGLDRNDVAALAAALTGVQQTLRRMGTESLSEALSGVMDSMPSLARELGKEAPNVVIEDQGLLVKSQLSGLLRNLFTHLMRNAVDHGLETAAERQAKGKAAQGRIDLRAVMTNGEFVMTLSDDGRGLALAKIRERAVERRFIDADATLTDEQVADLIFLPGFSTAEVVTEVSGRGVGMDAVRDFLARESGRIELRFRSKADEGQAFRAAEFVIHLPGAAAVAA
jgi:HPt (histidine-containing phosphotransfer) domain-containing protein